MPIYNYVCTSCDEEVDLIFTYEEYNYISNNNKLMSCPFCRGNLRRMLTLPIDIAYKGKGFYITDNKKGKESE